MKWFRIARVVNFDRWWNLIGWYDTSSFLLPRLSAPTCHLFPAFLCPSVFHSPAFPYSLISYPRISRSPIPPPSSIHPSPIPHLFLYSSAFIHPPIFYFPCLSVSIGLLLHGPSAFTHPPPFQVSHSFVFLCPPIFCTPYLYIHSSHVPPPFRFHPSSNSHLFTSFHFN